MKRLRSILLFISAILFFSAVGSHSIAQTNMLTNPGFEASGGSYDGWFTWEGTADLSTPYDDNIMRTDSTAAKCYGQYLDCGTGGTFSDGGFGQAFTSPVVGDTYTLRGYSFVSSGDTIPGSDTTVCDYNRMIAKVVFFNATSGGSELSGNEIVIGNYSTPRDEWIEFSVSAIAPPGAQRVEALFIYLQPPGCDDGAVYIDDTWFYQSATYSEPNILVNPSFSNMFITGWTTFGNAAIDNRYWAVHTPPFCAKLYGTFVEGSDSGIYQMFPADSGSVWKMTAHSLKTCREGNLSVIEGTNDNYITAKMVFLNADTVEVGASEKIILDSSSPLGTWTKHEILGQAPDSTAFIRAYLLFVSPSLLDGAGWLDDISLFQLETTDTEPTPGVQGINLHQNFPNPFNPMTRIDFELEKSGTVNLSVYDVAGRLIAILYDGYLDEGIHQVTWNGKTRNNTTAAAGVYFYTLRTENGMISKRMVLLR
jgi:hypothetical protein